MRGLHLVVDVDRNGARHAGNISSNHQHDAEFADRVRETQHCPGDRSRGGSSGLPAIAGYPHITVPAGFVYGLPVGISFFGRAWSEPVLIKLAYAFEQATRHRKPPQFAPTADLKV